MMDEAAGRGKQPPGGLARRLGPLVAAQACGAFVDNLAKNAMVVQAVFVLDAGGAGLSAAAGALFIAPFALFSARAGAWADGASKSRLVVAYKGVEVALMAFAWAALAAGGVPAMLAVLFGLGCQATLFGPVKHSILPELLAPRELLAGNGAVEATTFLAIVAGTVAGGALALLPGGATWAGAAGVCAAATGFAASLAIPRTPSPAAAPRGVSTRAILREAWAAPAIRGPVLGISWFWAMGGALMTELPVLARDTLGAEGSVLTLMLAVFAVGVGIGSVGCARLRHPARAAPWLAVGIGAFCLDFAWACASGRGAMGDAAAVLAGPGGWRALVDLAGAAACGGAFSVPLYAAMLGAAPPDSRARTVAACNIVNAGFMVASAGGVAALAAAGLEPPGVVAVFSLANLPVAAWIARGGAFDSARGVCLSAARPRISGTGRSGR